MADDTYPPKTGFDALMDRMLRTGPNIVPGRFRRLSDTQTPSRTSQGNVDVGPADRKFET